MRNLFVATSVVTVTIAMLGLPADAQQGGANGIGAAAGAGRAAAAGAPKEPVVDPAKKKAEEKAFNDAVNRIPPPDKKFDPWGNVRQGGK
jgi:hypothetical protein